MELGFFGGAETVTGSKFYIRSNNTQILIDCGMFQGLKALRLLNREPFPFDVRGLDAVVLTHAHLDHCGALPLLVKDGFKGPIYCTRPTLELVKIILLDSAKIQEEEAHYANKKGFSKHHPALPLYDVDEAQRVFPLLEPVEHHAPFDIGDLTVEYFKSGHILGAASVLVSSNQRSFFFSGDIGRKDDPLLAAPEPPPNANVIVMESTYGNRQHSPIPSKTVLKDCINEVIKNKSVLLIPSFSVGRAQNILQEISELKEAGEISRHVPVFFNSPMGMAASKLYADYPEFQRLDVSDFDESTSSVIAVKTAEDSKLLNESHRRPLVIVAASGMLTGGRVLHHFKAFAGDPKNVILLAGFQAAGTRGRDLLDGKKEIKVHGGFVKVNCKIVASDSFSAHADQKELLEWIGQARPEKVFLVHGEPEALTTLQKKIREKYALNVEIPQINSLWAF